MFLQVSVCPWGGCLPQSLVGYSPPEQTPLRADLPGADAPPGVDISREWTPPGEDTPGATTSPPPDQTPPWSIHPLSRHPLRETATAADGTLPTGMHSCCLNVHNVHL